jgi:hypothetical protein
LKVYFLTGYVILRETGRDVYGMETGIIMRLYFKEIMVYMGFIMGPYAGVDYNSSYLMVNSV